MDSNSLYHNRAHVALFGYTVEELNAVEEPAALFADREAAEEIHRSIRDGRSWQGETNVRTRAGRVIPAFVRADIIRDEHGRPIGIFGVFTDITERRAAERALAEERERSARAARLESLGMLASGVAHDFNNILTIVSCNATLVRTSQEFSPIVNQQLADIEVAAERAAELSRNLLGFRQGRPAEETADQPRATDRHRRARCGAA
jgi:two-component system, cell cycle sensor histidine kinase and response regulator CckA